MEIPINNLPVENLLNAVEKVPFVEGQPVSYVRSKPDEPHQEDEKRKRAKREVRPRQLLPPSLAVRDSAARTISATNAMPATEKSRPSVKYRGL